ncbi:DoxX protein [Micromonospora pattaloongensis]|uniref:DoxX protein n=1 Tax=Micromonospora pattaloongensis TaxID=405436 RepID=A0A1H3HTW4_9ACTN|nr:DoxX family protein [Micromonospora pattaloongensis]SDY18194.1 DoxX protein [Micromonospora pattaloongensis]
MTPVRTAARALLSGIFVVSGARALANPEQLLPRAKRVTDRVSPLLQKLDARLPSDGRTLVQINGAAQLVGGVLLATGHATRPAAAVLAGSLVPTTMAGHPFWTVDDRVERQTQQIHFLKNLGLLGGLLLAAADTEGRPGLRWRTTHAVDDGRRALRRTVRSAKRDARIAVRSAAAARHLPG